MEEITNKFKCYCDINQAAIRAHHLAAGAYWRYNDQLGIRLEAMLAVICTGLVSVLTTLFSAPHSFLGLNGKAPGLKQYQQVRATEKTLVAESALHRLAVFFARIQLQHVGRRP